jgi:hypothetical protein
LEQNEDKGDVMINKSVSLQWGSSEQNNTTISLSKVNVPEGLNRLVIGRTVAKEAFGSGYEMFLTNDELSCLSKAIEGYTSI